MFKVGDVVLRRPQHQDYWWVRANGLSESSPEKPKIISRVVANTICLIGVRESWDSVKFTLVERIVTSLDQYM